MGSNNAERVSKHPQCNLRIDCALCKHFGSRGSADRVGCTVNGDTACVVSVIFVYLQMTVWDEIVEALPAAELDEVMLLAFASGESSFVVLMQCI